MKVGLLAVKSHIISQKKTGGGEQQKRKTITIGGCNKPQKEPLLSFHVIFLSTSLLPKPQKLIPEHSAYHWMCFLAEVQLNVSCIQTLSASQ